MSERKDSYADTIPDIEKSSEVIYNELVRLYGLEMDAQDTLKDRANGLMVLNGTIITLATLVMIQLVTLVVTDKMVLLLAIIPYTLFILSLWFGINSFKSRDLLSLSADNLHRDYYRKYKDVILEQLSSNLAEFIDSNKEITDDRSYNVNLSISFFKYGIISFVVVMGIIGGIHYHAFL